MRCGERQVASAACGWDHKEGDAEKYLEGILAERIPHDGNARPADPKLDEQPPPPRTKKTTPRSMIITLFNTNEKKTLKTEEMDPEPPRVRDE